MHLCSILINVKSWVSQSILCNLSQTISCTQEVPWIGCDLSAVGHYPQFTQDPDATNIESEF
jgi:hypothetical protein